MPFGSTKDDVLPASSQQPEDEVGMKVAGLEEADAAALAQVAQQVELLVCEEAPVACREMLFRSSTKSPFAFVQRHRADLDDCSGRDTAAARRGAGQTRSPSCRGTPTA